MSRVLFLAPTLPWPQDSGSRIRSSQLLRGLREHHHVSLWCVERPESTSEDLAAASELCEELRVYPRSRIPLLRGLCGPVEQTWFHSASLVQALGRLTPGQFDLVHVDELAMLPMLPRDLSIPVVQHHHKLDLELCAELRSAGARRQLEIERWARLERESLERTPHQIFCSVNDAQLFCERHPGTQSAVIDNGVDCATIQPTGREREMDYLLWLGSTDYEPNARGLQQMLQELWPRLRRARPKLRLSIVGRGPRMDPAKLPPGVLWIGAVQDVRPWLSRASALVVPLNIGGGTRLKIIEAAAAGCPIVSTRVGAAGLKFQSETHLLLAPSIPALEQPLIRCLTHWNEAETRAVAARALVEIEYHWPELAARLARAWDRSLGS